MISDRGKNFQSFDKQQIRAPFVVLFEFLNNDNSGVIEMLTNDYGRIFEWFKMQGKFFNLKKCKQTDLPKC